MMLRRTASFSFAAACMTAIATMPAHAQTAGPYGPAPGYNTPQGPAAYGTPPGYTTPQGPAAYGTTPGYTTSQGPAAYGTTPGYTTPQGSAAYGSAPSYNSPQSSVPQANQSGVGQSASARRNVIESKQYDRAVETNRGFRQARMRKECGPITDPELRQSCLASFNREEAQTGSSTSSRSQGTGSGR